MANYQESELWKHTLARRANDPCDEPRSRLSAVYHTFWERGVALAQRISSDLPNLTLHDEAHLAALWDRASQLTGANYDINPLEAFIFGGAILLHDTGHAIAAYAGGLAELKATVEFRDALVGLLSRQKDGVVTADDIRNPPEDTVRLALFTTLRRLHARQAETLASRRFGEEFLIDNSELRESLAQLIGQVAASHQWDRTSLEDKLPEVQGAPGSMPQEWRIQPVKLACLLRCADAIQIDQRRAPAFPFALHMPQGESRLHWFAQRLAQPVVQPGTNGPGALIFTSQNGFTDDKADAWWIAHDLIRVAHDELQGCFQLMKDLALPNFAVDRVLGAETPQRLERYVRAVGWQPVSAEVRITNVEHVVRLFGGEALYGRDPSVPLRELLQNAADAVRARRQLTGDKFYEGRIVVSLTRAGEDGFGLLAVMDDGIGMSERVLTGPLLEFGKSFWTSQEAQEEFPGLVGAALAQAGRYGIGFFSTLMITNQVKVTSRRFDANDKPRSLTFREGLKLRPLLLKADGGSLGQFSTRIELRLSSDNIHRLLTCWQHPHRGNSFAISLRELVAHLCPCLDCNVRTQEDTDADVQAHSQNWYDEDPLRWLRDVLFADRRADETLDRYLVEAAPRLRVLHGSGGRACGRAAIGFGLIETGIGSIDGLTSGQSSRNVNSFSEAYVGAIGLKAEGPQRRFGVPLGPETDVTAWSTEQATLLVGTEVSNQVKYVAAQNVAAYDGNPTSIAVISINRNLTSLNEVYTILAAEKAIYAPIRMEGGTSRAQIASLTYQVSPVFERGLNMDEVDFIEFTMEGWNVARPNTIAYHGVPTEETEFPSSFLACLERYAAEQGRELHCEVVKDAFLARYKGVPSQREKLFAGAELRTVAIKLSLT